MSNYFNFDPDERVCIQKFDKYLFNEAVLLTKLLTHLESFVQQTSVKIKGKEYPDWTIELFLVNNLTVLYNSFDRLRKGYLGVSESLLRQVIESMSLSMYFYEFPNDEVKYRKDPKSFYAKLKSLGYLGWIEGVLHRVDNEGKKFVKGNVNIGQTWYNFLFKNLGDEFSNFLHPNIDYILGVVFESEDVNKQLYNFGPHFTKVNVFKNAIWHIIECTNYNLIIYDKCFKKYIAINDFNLIKEAVDGLNRWKREYKTIVDSKK